MNEVPLPAPRAANDNRFKERFGGFIDSRRSKMFGLVEVAGLASSCLVLLLVVFGYLYFLVPARSRLATLNADRNHLRSNLQKLDGIVHQGRDTNQTVDKIAVSLDHFEKVDLVKQDEGRMGLYGELNRLIIKNGLKNTSGPTYSALEPLGAKATPGKSVSTKWQSVYPGIAVMVTVEGQYQSVRHFIQDIERSTQFVIINQVELQSATQGNSPASETPDSGSGSRGSPISLQLNMATYFQRSDSDNRSGSSQEQ
jgi:Tfp pilus assembly protein PilO